MGMLLKLPNELTFQILGDLEKDALLALARSCRHLNIIVTSYYLFRHRMPDPSDKIRFWKEKDFDVLPFLRVSTLLTSSQDVAVSFTSRNYLDKIRGLEDLIVKLSSVKSVMLDLSSISAFSDQEDEARFIKAIRNLLTTIIARSCNTLRISSGPSLMHSHHTIEPKAQHIGPSKLSRIFIAPYKKMLRKSSNIVDILSPHNFPTSKLTELWIRSGTLFDHPFLHWTTHLINASPITHLALGNFCRKHFPWDDLFSTIHSPTLSWVLIGDNLMQLPYSSVAAFLARHQTITSLLCRGLSRDGPDYPRIFLPRLSSLAASYSSVIYLLEDAAAFPSLHDVYLHEHPSAPFDPSIVNNALECVSRCPNELELTLKFGQDKGFIAWLDVDVNDNSRVERLLRRVICLKLPIYTFSTKTLSVLPKWLALFPALRLLTFNVEREAIPPNFAHSVIQACSQLETLTINEETHTVATWLAMKN